MRKILALLLAVVLVASLAACGNNASTDTNSNSESVSSPESNVDNDGDDEYPITGNIVYFKDTLNWSAEGDIYVHYWNSAGEMVKWPGDKMTSLGDDVYSYDLPDDVEFIIFNRNGDSMSKEGQTRDIPYDGSVRKFQCSDKQDEMKASFVTDWDGNEITSNMIDDGSGANQLIVNDTELDKIEKEDDFEVKFTDYSLKDENGDATFVMNVKNNTKKTLSEVKFFVLAYNEDKHARIIDIGENVNLGIGDDAYIQEYQSEGGFRLEAGESKEITLDAKKKSITGFNAIVSSYKAGSTGLNNPAAYEWYKNAYTNKVVDNSAIFTRLEGFFDDNNLPEGFTKDDRGVLSLKETFLFEPDSSKLSSKGKADLKKAIDAYVKAISTDDGILLIKKIIVEGHTDNDGSREYNQKLSEERAKTVMNYCIQLHPILKGVMEAKGCAYDNPVKKSDGTIDKEASRRVCFVAE